MNKSFMWIVGVIVIFVAFLGSAVYFKNSSTNGLPIPGIAVETYDHVRGSGSVVLIEYSDFQCPACKAYFPVVEQLLKDYGSKITFVYRNFPLAQHRNSLTSARAAEAAGKQGKFWEMYEKLFPTQDTWGELAEVDSIFQGYAKDLGLDSAKFNLDYNDANLKAKILNDYKSGVNLGVQGTPTFYINGKKINSPQGIDEFKQLVDQALSETSGISTSTTSVN
jgi:protein-disulfide isomerase